MADDELGVVNIGAREIYDLVNEVRGDVRSLTDSKDATGTEISDIKSRLAILERWMWAIPASVVTGVVSAAVVIYK